MIKLLFERISAWTYNRICKITSHVYDCCPNPFKSCIGCENARYHGWRKKQ